MKEYHAASWNVNLDQKPSLQSTCNLRGSAGFNGRSVGHSVTHNVPFDHVNYILRDIGGHVGKTFDMF